MSKTITKAMNKGSRTKIELTMNVTDIKWPDDSGRTEKELGVVIQLYLDEAKLGGTKFAQLAKKALKAKYDVEPISLKVVGAKLHILEEDNDN